MLTRLLQAIAITSAIYLTMITHQSPRTQSALLASPYHSAIRAERFTQLLAEMLDVLLAPSQRGAGRHHVKSINVIVD